MHGPVALSDTRYHAPSNGLAFQLREHEPRRNHEAQSNVHRILPRQLQTLVRRRMKNFTSTTERAAKSLI